MGQGFRDVIDAIALVLHLVLLNFLFVLNNFVYCCMHSGSRVFTINIQGLQTPHNIGINSKRDIRECSKHPKQIIPASKKHVACQYSIPPYEVPLAIFGS